MGTPFYMAPEQAFGERDVDARADVWALGVILYECSSGQRPITGDTLGQIFKRITAGPTPPLAQIAPYLPAEFETLVANMLERDREKRLRDLSEPFELLQRLSRSSSPAFAPLRSTGDASSMELEAGSEVARQRRTLTIGVASVGLVALVIGASALLRARGAATEAEAVAARSPLALPAVAALPAATATPTVAPAPTLALPAASSVQRTHPASSAKVDHHLLSAPPRVEAPAATAATPLLPGGVQEALPF